MIHLEDLAIGYKAGKHVRTVASGITGDIRAGELTCLLGANGAGKSTLLRTLSAFQPRLQGVVSVDGRDINECSAKQLARLVGVVLTERVDLPNMTVTDVVALGRNPHTGFWGTLESDDRRAVDEAIELVGIAELAHRRLNTLSDGERQKAMIAKALAQQTPVILLDEPTAFLDYPSKVEVLLLLHRLSRQAGKAIFLSTHDLELALQVADRLWLLGEGGEVSEGTPEDLALNGTLARLFSRDSVVFDEATGAFAIRFECNRQAQLVGNDRRCAMVRKALRRIGIEATDSKEPRLAIVVGEEGYRVCLDGTAAGSAATIEQLLSIVEALA